MLSGRAAVRCERRPYRKFTAAPRSFELGCAGLTRWVSLRGMAGAMNADEYLKLADAEDRMWYFRSLHRHVRRELERLEKRSPGGEARSQILDAGCGTGGLIL